MCRKTAQRGQIEPVLLDHGLDYGIAGVNRSHSPETRFYFVSGAIEKAFASSSSCAFQDLVKVDGHAIDRTTPVQGAVVIEGLPKLSGCSLGSLSPHRKGAGVAPAKFALRSYCEDLRTGCRVYYRSR